MSQCFAAACNLGMRNRKVNAKTVKQKRQKTMRIDVLFIFIVVDSMIRFFFFENGAT
jgi:TRAP-type mannitol/chloroaromatic compound transport system permease large subunit